MGAHREEGHKEMAAFLSALGELAIPFSVQDLK